MRREKGFTLIELMIVIAIIAIIAAIAIPGLLNSQRASNERNASGSLKTIATAQADFRSNDRDNDNAQDFWTGDVAGLYSIDNTSTGAATVQQIKLVEVSVALADLTANAAAGCTVPGGNNYATACSPGNGVQSSKAGFWYMTLDNDNSPAGGAVNYQQVVGTAAEAVHNSSRFGAAAMPEAYGSSGTKVYIINESNTMFKRDFGADVLVAGTPPTLGAVFDGNWPTDAILAANWSKMD